MEKFVTCFEDFASLLQLPSPDSVIHQFQLNSPMKKKIMNIFTSSPNGNSLKIFLVVLAIYALIALVTYLVW